MKRNISLRETVANAVDKAAYEDDRVVVVNADLMKSARLLKYKKHHPERTFNMGIAEQSMVSFSAGLVHEGYIPFDFSMAPFISMRACEQVRTDVAYGDLPVRFMASYSGMSGGISRATHWGLEDVGIMSCIPRMTVIELSDGIQAEKLIEESFSYCHPIYFRITVEPVRNIYEPDEEFKIGKANIVCDGNDGAFICSGITVSFAMEAAKEIFLEYGKKIRDVDMHTIKPLDKEAIMDAATTGVVVAAQDHNVWGGLGQQIAGVIAEAGLDCKFVNIGIPDRFDAMAHAPFLYQKYGYDKEGLKKIMTKLLADMGGYQSNKNNLATYVFCERRACA